MTFLLLVTPWERHFFSFFFFKYHTQPHTLVFISIRKWKLDALNFWNAHSFWDMPEKRKRERMKKKNKRTIIWDRWSNSSIHQGNFGFTLFSIHRIVEGLKRYNSLIYKHFPFLSPLLFFSVLYSLIPSIMFMCKALPIPQLWFT